MTRALAPAGTASLHASAHHAMSESSKLSRQRPPPLSQGDADTPLILADRQAPSQESSITPEPDSGGQGTAKHRSSFLLGTPSIPQTLSPSTAPRPVVVPPKSPLLSAFAAPAAAAPFPPLAPKVAFARSLSFSSNRAPAAQAGEGKLREGLESLVRAKTQRSLGNAASMPWQAEDKPPPSTRLLPSLQIAPRPSRRSLDTKSDNGSTRQHYFLPTEVIRTSGTNGPMAPDFPQDGRGSAPAQSTVATAALPSSHSGSCSSVSDDGSVPLQPRPPKQQPCAFRRKTILAPIHHLRQPLQRDSSPSQDRSSDSDRDGAEFRHHHHQQQQQQQQQQLPGPHLGDTTSLSGAQSLSSPASSFFLGGGALKRRSSGIQKQVTIALEHDLGGTEASMALHQSIRRRSRGQKLSRPGTPAVGLQRQAYGEGGRPVGRLARWSSAGLLGTEDTPLSRELLACERERRLRSKAFKSCEQLAQANARANPSAFCAVAAEEEEAKRGLAAGAALQSLKELKGRPSNDKQAVDHFHTQLRLLRASRSFYHAPEVEKQQVTRALLVPKGPWALEHSLFQQRALENDAHDMFDTPEVLDAQFEQDWQGICQRGGLARTIAAATVAPSALYEEAIDRHPVVVLQLEEVRRELRNHFQLIRSCFIFFAALSPSHCSHELMAMRMQDYCEFARCCNLLGPRSPLCEPTYMEAIFKASKGPAGLSGVKQQQGASQESAATHPHLLNRSEFLECIVRLAIVKHMQATHDANGQPNVANAVERLLEEDIEPNLSPSAKVDANAFREERLYSEEMEVCIRSHWTLLTMSFKVYSAGSGTLGIEGWLALLAAGALLGRANHTGIDKHAAKVVFMLSQASVVDKAGSLQSRDGGLKFFDFVEALARLSEVLCPPTPDELSALFQSRPSSSHTPISAEASEHLWMALMEEQRRGSGQSGPASTTSIADTEAISTMPPLLGKLSDPCAASKAGRVEASALPQLNGWPKSAAGIEISPATTLLNCGGNNNNDNMSTSSGSSSSSSQGSSRVHTFFKDMLQWQQLCKHRIREAGLDKALHSAARQRPLLDSFEPMMELLESSMRRTWGCLPFLSVTNCSCSNLA